MTAPTAKGSARSNTEPGEGIEYISTVSPKPAAMASPTETAGGRHGTVAMRDGERAPYRTPSKEHLTEDLLGPRTANSTAVAAMATTVSRDHRRSGAHAPHRGRPHSPPPAAGSPRST